VDGAAGDPARSAGDAVRAGVWGGPGGPPPAAGRDLTDAVPVLGAPATTAVVRQINLYPYPELPACNGYGNVDEAASYVGRVSQALQQPIHGQLVPRFGQKSV
jgi:hypothetical protein